MSVLPSRLAIAVVATTLFLGACGSDDGGGGTDGQVAIEVTADADEKPEFDVPSDQEPPDQLLTDVVREGDGETAATGDDVVVQYVGKSWSTGEQFDASWDRGQPFSFQLGAGRVIPGWEQGVAGMRVGERRTLIIPPDLAYGPSGGGPIGPNETLVFVVDLVEIR